MNTDDITDLHKHFYYYSTGRHSRNVDFIFSSQEVTCLSKMTDYSKASNKDNLKHLTDIFRKNNQPVYITDITKTTTNESGFIVLKAIIPPYTDLAQIHRFSKQKTPRIQKYQEQYGLELNNDPHPFP